MFNYTRHVGIPHFVEAICTKHHRKRTFRHAGPVNEFAICCSLCARRLRVLRHEFAAGQKAASWEAPKENFTIS